MRKKIISIFVAIIIIFNILGFKTNVYARANNYLRQYLFNIEYDSTGAISYLGVFDYAAFANAVYKKFSGISDANNALKNGDLSYKDIESIVKKLYYDGSTSMWWVTAMYDLVTDINKTGDGHSYTDLANNNDSYLLKYAFKAIDTAFKAVSYSKGVEIDTKENKYETRSDKFEALFNSKVIEMMFGDAENCWEQLAKARQEIMAAIDYADGSMWFDQEHSTISIDGKELRVKDSYENKKDYTSDQVNQYLAYFGNRYGVNSSQKNDLIMKWAAVLVNKNNMVELSHSYYTKLEYDSNQIALYYLLYGFDFNTDDLKEKHSLINEWHSVIVKGTHTNWYKGQFLNNVSKYNKQLTTEEAVKMQIEIKDYLENNNKPFSLEEAKDLLGKITIAERDARIETMIAKTKEQWIKDEQDLEDSNNIYTYKHPKQAANEDEPMNADQAMSDANGLLDAADQTILSTEDIQSIMNPIYSMTLTIATVIIAVVGSIMGTKFATGTLAQKALIKSMLWPYAIGCAVIYGAFGIWHLAVTVLSGM